MNALRHGLVSVAILAGTLLAAAAQPGRPGSVAVPVYSGNHPDFGRVVFDTPANVAYRVTRDGDRVTVRFTATVKLGAVPAPPRNVLSIHPSAAQAELIIAPGARLHDMRMGSRIVLDVFDPVPGGAAASPATLGRPVASVPAPHVPRVSPTPPKHGSTGIAAGRVDTAQQRAPEPRGAPPVADPAQVAVNLRVPASQANLTPQADNGSGVPAVQSATMPSGAREATAVPPALPVDSSNAATDIVAQRGDIKLTAADVRGMLEHLDPVQRAQVQATTAALADFVRDRLMSQTLLAEAHAAKWDQNADVIARADVARETVIVQSYLASRTKLDPNYPSQADIAATYETNKARFAVPTLYHVAQIVILVPAGAARDVDEAARRRAENLRQQALDPKADFAELANKDSQDRATAGRGGDLGWVRADQLVPALRDVVTILPENAISEPVRSAEAWHVLKLLGSKPPSVLSLDQVRDALVQALRQNAAQQAARAYVDDMLRKEPIILNEIDLDHRVAAVR